MAVDNEIAPIGERAEKSNSILQSTEQHNSQQYDEEGHDGKMSNERPTPGRLGLYLWKFEQRLLQYNLEARGLERVHASERMKKLSWLSYLQAALLWVSMNLAANNMTLGMLGPATYGLSFRDSSLCAVFGAFVGALIAAWMATWGPVSGIRTMVLRLSGYATFKQLDSDCLLGIRTLCNGLVAKQNRRHFEPDSDDRLLFD